MINKINKYFEQEKKILEDIEKEFIHTMKVIDINNNKELNDPDTFFYGILFDNEDIIHTKDIKIKVYTKNGIDLYHVVDETIYPYGQKVNHKNYEQTFNNLFKNIFEDWCNYWNIDIEKANALLKLQNYDNFYVDYATNVNDFLKELGYDKTLNIFVENYEYMSNEIIFILRYLKKD